MSGLKHRQSLVSTYCQLSFTQPQVYKRLFQMGGGVNCKLTRNKKKRRVSIAFRRRGGSRRLRAGLLSPCLRLFRANYQKGVPRLRRAPCCSLCLDSVRSKHNKWHVYLIVGQLCWEIPAIRLHPCSVSCSRIQFNIARRALLTLQSTWH